LAQLSPLGVTVDKHLREKKKMGLLEGKTAFVIGAGSGIGKAIARLFAQHGANLALMDISQASLQAAKSECSGAVVTTHVLDVASEPSVRRAFEDAIQAHGGLGILVNSAGVLDETPLVEMDFETWSKTIAVDLTGVYLTARYATRHMVSNGGGRIINIASQLGIKGGANMAHYVAAKAGVIGMGKALALEMAPFGITVNSIAPGPVETPLIKDLSSTWRTSKQAELPLDRFGRPEEIAPTALLLASSPGGDLYTGQTLGPNSGDVMP
jgi:3-oxoacyl-[acyl-carrier protein] reductase